MNQTHYLRPVWLIDVLLILAVGVLASNVWANDVSFSGDRVMVQKIAGFGPLVSDMDFVATGDQKESGDKVDCQVYRRLGGGAYNTLRHARGLGAEVAAIFLTGPDGPEAWAANQAKLVMENPRWLPSLEHDRLSAIVGDRCFTARSPVAKTDLPDDVRQTISQSAVTIIAPLTARDTRLAAQVIRLASKPILMLSMDQLQNAQACLLLMAAAHVTVLNQVEIAQLTGLADPRDSVQRVHELGVRNIIVTGKTGVTALLDGNWHWQPSFPCRVKRTVSAGDVFVGSVAAGLAADLGWREILERAAAACAVHLSGRDGADSESIQLVIAAGIPQVVSPRVAQPARTRWYRAVSLTSAATAVGVAISLVLGLVLR